MNNFFEELMNKKVFTLGAIFLAVLSIFFVIKSLGEIKRFSLIGSDYTPANVISVSGTGEVFAVPDLAEISFDVREEGKTATDAQKKATAKINKILNDLKKFGIDEKDIKTTGYNIYPKYEYRRESAPLQNGGTEVYPYPGKQVIVGYEVSQNILLKIRKTENVGAIVTMLGSANVSNVSGVNFSIDDEEKIKAEARRKAIDDAKNKAEILARDLGVSLVRIVSFSENGSYPPLMYGKAAMSLAAPDRSPVAPEIPAGENKITSQVTIVYEIH